MSMVKHKRDNPTALTAQREDELKALAKKSDDGIDYSDIPSSDDEPWSEAVRGKFYRPLKTQASVRIDADVMEWLKRPGKGYQTRLNAILREAMIREQNKKS
ncbi:TPA: BrnA antitoxin family protein [Raoultella ornithinolytica]|uniref:BrnA antitoxin family protein n=1 Tax=Raoultella ornithinolytica TaxID=54291 RepID=UPI000BFF22CB|nr:BrnA antitoxin family protein [Raoultella ornithinolytica]ATM22981.1 toxin-antitoxin system, antitoxin component [Raoultella ornithinolytica]MDV0601742.1 BrnA antitoxin family protein [Raoultella ornithinolytica]